MSEHTPTPWRIGAGDDYYIAADGYPSEFIGHFKGDDMGSYLAFVGNRPKDFGEANAAFIVKAVNNHDALVKALEAIVDLTARVDDGCNCTICQIRRIAIKALDVPPPSPDLKASQRPTVSSETNSPPTQSHLAGKGEL